MIQANKICLSFGSQKVFDNISFTIAHDQRIGLVGLNGSGKSTLLKAIAKQQGLDSGSVSIVSSKKIAYLPQEVVLNSDKTVTQEALATFDQLYALQQENIGLEAQLDNDVVDPAVVERYAIVQEQLANWDQSHILAEVKRMLTGLGFSPQQMDGPVNVLSVGWKMRLVLAKLLLLKADFYLLDEPTNHLDIIAKDWFLRFLKEASFGFLLVCHERYVLDSLCDTILGLEWGKGTFYRGNYSTYEQQRDEQKTLLEAAYAQQQREIKAKTAVIERFKAGTRAKQAQSMLKALDKIERIELPPTPKNISFNFSSIPYSGRIVLEVKNVAHQFGAKQLFKNVSFVIERGQKVVLIAANGVGKTTLFNLIAKKLAIAQGSIEFGHNVMYALFDQDQNKALNLSLSVIENIEQAAPAKSQGFIRTFLGSFLFSSDDVRKKVNVLSGGEKNRVGMVKTLMQDANLLLLDEPTNHLDIPSKEILLKALQQYQGTLFFVSHDHDFINHLATHVMVLTPEGTYTYEGNYNAYLDQIKGAVKEVVINTGNHALSTKPSMGPDSFELQRQVKRLEQKITRLEQDIIKIQAQFADLDYGTVAFNKAESVLGQLQAELKSSFSEWEMAQAKISGGQ